MGDFDATRFWSGQRFEGEIPPGVRLWVGPGNPSGYLANPISWPIISERLRTILRPLIERTCQFLPLPLFRESTMQPVAGYVLMNVTRVISAIERNHSQKFTVGTLYFDHNVIPRDVHVFRLGESNTVLVVSDAFVDAVWNQKPTGISFIKTHRKSGI
jgi:hypothetical protein